MKFYKKVDKTDGYPGFNRQYEIRVRKEDGATYPVAELMYQKKSNKISFVRVSLWKWHIGFSTDFALGGFKIYLPFSLELGISDSSDLRVHWSGSIAKPRDHWKLQVGRLFFGGNTPKLLKKYFYRPVKEECPKCGKKSLTCTSGFAGEPMEYCDSCDYSWCADPRPYCK